MDAIIEKKNRRSISTHIKILTRIGALPDEYKNIIHRSQLHRYENESTDKHIGHELAQLVDDKIQLIRDLNKHQNAEKGERKLKK